MKTNYNEMISNIIDNFDYNKVLGPVEFYGIDGNKLECKVEGDWKHAHKNFENQLRYQANKFGYDIELIKCKTLYENGDYYEAEKVYKFFKMELTTTSIEVIDKLIKILTEQYRKAWEEQSFSKECDELEQRLDKLYSQKVYLENK